MTEELVESLNIKPEGVYIDCTGGGGGHAKRVLEKLSEEGSLIVLDRDLDAIKRLRNIFSVNKNVTIIHSNFSDIDDVMKNLEIDCVDGLYADFGLSSYQLTDAARGFSFKRDGFLDMRMDKSKGITAYDVINSYSRETLSNIFKKYGEEGFADRIAGAVVKERVINKIQTTQRLSSIIFNTVPKKFHKKGQDPSTKTFQALRIYINKELESIESLLGNLVKLVKKGGRVAFVSFHSLEDRLVKDMLNYYSKECVCPPEFPECRCEKVKSFKILNKKPIIPTNDEIVNNPLSRSAKMRVAEKIV